MNAHDFCFAQFTLDTAIISVVRCAVRVSLHQGMHSRYQKVTEHPWRLGGVAFERGLLREQLQLSTQIRPFGGIGATRALTKSAHSYEQAVQHAGCSPPYFLSIWDNLEFRILKVCDLAFNGGGLGEGKGPSILEFRGTLEDLAMPFRIFQMYWVSMCILIANMHYSKLTLLLCEDL